MTVELFIANTATQTSGDAISHALAVGASVAQQILSDKGPRTWGFAGALADAATAPLIVGNQDIYDLNYGGMTGQDILNTGVLIPGVVAFPVAPEITIIAWGFAGNAGAFGW